ncbi:MAG: phosphate acyltransferase PlsX, partial [Myxococcales bacterium]|nr:phosphate acyltransferase PlsX [Myxococcales bacterium]
MTTIVIDTCAGKDQGTEALAAAAIASLELDVQLVVVGDEDKITEALLGMAHDAERLRVVHAADPLPVDLDPHLADRQAPRSSVAVGLELTAREEDAIFVSAGPPGVIVSQALRALGRLPAVHRAALAAVYPTLRHRGPNDDPFALLLDVGATIECTSAHLVTFAAMGAAYASKISSVERPRVGLLANGPTASAAPPRIRAAHARLQDLHPGFEYIGLVRADQVTHGDADVIVTDGFSGDVLVRTLEGVATTAEALLR